SRGADGTFSFSDLGPGTYRLRQVVPGGAVATTGLPADVVALSGTASAVGFGDFRLATISGTAFNDLNGDGVRQAGEPGQAGRVIFLDTNNNGTPDAGEPTATTGPDRHYPFSDPGPGA